MRPVYFPFLAAMCWAAGAEAAVIPDCAGKVEIQGAHIVRVERNGVLVLADGRAVLLEGIRLPDGALHDQALDTLRDLATAGPLTLTATAPKQDRYDRVRVQAFGSGWLQAALLGQGLARVQIAPDRGECSPDLYEAENRARARHLGLWADAAYAPRAPETAKGTTGSFQLIDGWVTSVGMGSGRVFIDFGSDGQRQFSAVVQPEDRRSFKGYDFDALIAHRIRVRGIVQDYRGRPEIALSNPQQIEMLN